MSNPSIARPAAPPPTQAGAHTRAQRLVERLDPTEDYNFEHFRIRHMAAEFLRTGLAPGTPAPDFELPCTRDGRVRLSNLRGRR
jgi:hypothetical protein